MSKGELNDILKKYRLISLMNKLNKISSAIEKISATTAIVLFGYNIFILVKKMTAK